MRKVDIDDIYIGNGASELIVMAMQALLNNGDEMLVPPRLSALDCGRDPLRWSCGALSLR